MSKPESGSSLPTPEESEKLVRDVRSIGKDLPLTEIAASARRTLESEGVHMSAWEDRGGGDRQKGRLDYVKNQLLAHITEIEGSYAEPNPDTPTARLVEGLKLIHGIADNPTHSIFVVVGAAVEEYKAQYGEEFARKRSMYNYDSLDSLQAAFEQLIGAPPGEHRQMLIENFIERRPSGLWEKPKLKEALLSGVDESYRLITTILNESAAIPAFMRRYQLEFIRQGLPNVQIPRNRKDPNFERALRNARALPWPES